MSKFVRVTFIEAGLENHQADTAKIAVRIWGGTNQSPTSWCICLHAFVYKSRVTYVHIGIATGNALTIVHAANGVKESSSNGKSSTFSNWGWHGGIKLS